MIRPAACIRYHTGICVSQYHINAKTDPYRETNFTGNVNFLNFSPGETFANESVRILRYTSFSFMNCLQDLAGEPIALTLPKTPFETRQDEKQDVRLAFEIGFHPESMEIARPVLDISKMSCSVFEVYCYLEG